MNSKHGVLIVLLAFSLLLSGCSTIGDRDMSMTLIYLVVFILSLCILFGYSLSVRKKDKWFLALLLCVAVINGGYFWLSGAKTLSDALMANRFSYLGSAFLPMTMLMIILRVCHIRIPKVLPWVLTVLALCVFLVAASPGILDIYYREVTLSTVQGVTVLHKVYGPWHKLYLVYLLLYFFATAGISVRAVKGRRLPSAVHIFVLAGAVIINMGVWLLEQLVRMDFELLSVSYLICEGFLLSFSLIMPENEPVVQPASADTQDIPESPLPSGENTPSAHAHFLSQLSTLTPAEKNVYALYVSGCTSRQVMDQLNITENTLKYHNRNIYGKLGVSSRKEMLTIAHSLTDTQNTK